MAGGSLVAEMMPHDLSKIRISRRSGIQQQGHRRAVRATLLENCSSEGISAAHIEEVSLCIKELEGCKNRLNDERTSHEKIQAGYTFVLKMLLDHGDSIADKEVDLELHT